MADREPSITQVLQAVSEGDPLAADNLLPLVYRELKGMAHARLARRPRQTLRTTDLVHECWLRIAANGAEYENRRHFFGAAVRAMRNILVEEARRRTAQKRDVARRVDLPEDIAALRTDPAIEDVLTFNQALEKLETDHERAAKVVGLRFFTGLSMPEVAEVTGTSLATAERDWRFARAWLENELEESLN